MKPAQPRAIVDDADLRFIRWMERVASGAAVVAVAGGLAVLLGWWLDIEVLKSLLHPGRIAMNPLTAVAFVLAGASLWLLRGEQTPEGRRRVGMGLGLAVVGIALLVLPRFAVGLDPGVDRLLFRSRLGTNVMAPNTASTFLLVGLALSLLQTRIRRFWPSQLLILVALGLTLFSLTGYLFGVRALYGVAGYIPMALNSALVFLSLCIGILAARPEREPVAIALSPTAGGALVRRLLPAALVIPLILGMLHLRGQRAGLYEPELGLSIFALATIILFNLLIWWYGAVIRRTDQERRQAVKAVRESEARTRLIIDTAHDAFIAMDAAGVITDWNRQAEATFGWTRSAAIGRIVADTIIPQQFREAHAQGLDHFLSTGEGPFLNHRIEISGLHLDGREFPVEMTITPIERADGWIFSAFVHDISERKEAERQLQEKNRLLEDATHAKSDFLANMSHEIRTPMNGVIGMTELLLNTDLSDQQREYATLVQQSSEALLGLLNDILDFSKIEAGKLELEAILFSLRESLGDTMQALAVRAAEKDLELLYHIPAEVPDRLIGDPGRLRQIVVNLAGNAIKFTERGEVVATVSTEAASGEDVTLHVAIRDTGIGIPPEKQEIIFDAFSQADSSMSRRFGGTGLGLAISMELVARMGGRMWVESEPGTGSIFHFTARFTRQKREPRRLPLGADELRDLPVLVVDDNATNRRILHEMLASWGMRPVLADSGPSALAELESAVAAGRPFALVLLDGMMPGMDGYTLAERIHEQPHTADLPLMMLSSAGRTRDAVRGEGVGIARSLTKPVKQSVLLDAILDVLEAGESEIDASREPAGEREPGGYALRILLAEDGVVNQKVAVSLLERRGHSVHVAGNGRKALSALERESFDLVLMDVQMPEMDGFETTAAIRAREREHGGHLPIIAMTAHAMKGDRERCLAAGMDDYLSKPIRADELYEKVERVSPPAAGDGGTGDAAAQVDQPLATGAPTMTEQPMDWEQALERIGGNEEILWDILEVFLAESPKMMQEIRTAIDAGAHAELRRAAHTLKGSAALFVAEPTVRAAQRLESMGETENLEGVESAWTELEAEREQLAATLREATARRTSQT